MKLHDTDYGSNTLPGDTSRYTKPWGPDWFVKIFWRKLYWAEIKDDRDVSVLLGDGKGLRDASQDRACWEPRWRQWPWLFSNEMRALRVKIAMTILGEDIYRAMADFCPKCGTLHYFFKQEGPRDG